MMDRVEIVIDDREQAVIPYFNGFKMPDNITYNVSRINYGDYSVLYKNNILFIIERKTWCDLAASMRDGRKENVKKLINIREETGCKILYLIEGNPTPKSTCRFGRIPYNALRAHLDHLAFRDNIHILHSKDTKHTVERIVEIVKNYLTISPSPLLKYDILDTSVHTDQPQEQKETNETNENIDGGGLAKLKEKIIMSDESIIYKIWCCVPNITEKTACIFINRGYHISDLILGRIPKTEIYAMKYSNNFIIGKRSEKIWDASRFTEANTHIFIKMLTQINGITKTTAAIILESAPFDKLLSGEITADALKNIVKSPNGRKIGPKIASAIITMFVK